MNGPTAAEIQAARKASGLTQEEAADLIGYSRRSWQEWEGGRRKMRRLVLDEFKRLCNLADHQATAAETR